MPNLETLGGQENAVKREIRSGSGAAIDDIKKQSEDEPNSCDPDICE